MGPHQQCSRVTFFVCICCLVNSAFTATEPMHTGAMRRCMPESSCSIIVSPPLPGDEPMLMAVREDHACGAPPDSMLQSVNPVQGSLIVASNNHSLFQLGLMGPSPGLYRLCVCSSGCKVAPDTLNPHAFDADIGDLLVRGPVRFVPTPSVCVAGGPSCVVNISALGISSGLSWLHIKMRVIFKSCNM